MLKRVYNAKRFNAIINDPSILPFVVFGEQKHLDATNLVNDQDNVLLMDNYGAIFFEKIENTIYKAHTQFLPEGRGKNAIEASKEAVEHMFLKTPCIAIIAEIPAYNRASKLIARRVGFKYIDTTENAWPQNGITHDVDNFILTYDNWRTLNER